ncbi:DUF1707 domain-containing protein [Nocardioides sp.]|uniref:DUF1707 SHOCT-like domain-containing protein n=1 Tax=Nocardioides sp. TaxID=35761 RepID=UPI0035278704
MTGQPRPDQPRPDQTRLRLSDAEREEAARLLGEHFAAGRLTADEHAERLDAAYAARTRGELPVLFADLPGGSPWTPPAPSVAWAGSGSRPWPQPGGWTPSRSRAGGAGVPTVLRLLAGLLLLVLVLTHLPWILLGLAVFLVASRAMGRRRVACRGATPAWHR